MMMGRKEQRGRRFASMVIGLVLMEAREEGPRTADWEEVLPWRRQLEGWRVRDSSDVSLSLVHIGLKGRGGFAMSAFY